MAAEAEAALLSSNDAIGWYDAKLKLAKKILYQVYPEVSSTRPDGSANPAYDPAAEHAFDYATAVTSNGLSVIDNYLMASRQYESWKSSNSITPKGSNAGDIKKFKVSGSAHKVSPCSRRLSSGTCCLIVDTTQFKYQNFSQLRWLEVT